MELLCGIVLRRLLLLYLCIASSCTLMCIDCVLVAPPPLPGRSRGTGAGAAVQVGFYNKTCPRAEGIIRAQVQKRFALDKTITPALLRMLFHDSFVRGADASILLDSTPGNVAEKEALPNLTIRGFDLIDETKDAVEAACPGIVSCADILVLAVRDSVVLAGGPEYEVPTGRLDGKVSVKEEALNLPSPAFPVEQSLESFRQKGLDLEDMVALLGAHTVGVALCGFFNDRLFNFHGTGMADPTMNPQLVTQLSTVCPNPFFTESNADPPIDLDQSTPALFDAVYYSQILAGNGILQIDQAITADPAALGLVHSFTSATTFFPAFIRSIIKMGNIDVITGNSVDGEIRRKCNVSNAASGMPATKPAPAPAGPITAPAPVTKPTPAGQVRKPPATAKPTPGGQVSKPPPTARPTPAAHKPPSTAKPTPASHVSKPPASARPITPVPKPPSTPARQVRKPPPTARPATPVPKPPTAKSTPARQVGKPPATARPTTPARKPPATSKPSPAGHVSMPPTAKPPPTGHVSKPPAASRPSPAARKPTPAAARKPTPAGHGRKTPPTVSGQVTPVAKPAPPGRSSNGKSPIPKPPFGGHVSKPPVTAGHVSRPSAGSRRRTPPHL